MKLRHILTATTLLSAATATISKDAHAWYIGNYERSVGSGDVTAKYKQTGTAKVEGLYNGGSGDLWLDAKVFSKAATFIHIAAHSSSAKNASGNYDEYASAYTYLDGTFVGPTSYTCATYDTCSEATTTIERALWNEKKSFGVLPGVTLNVSGSLNTKATFSAWARTYAGPGSLGVGNLKGRSDASVNADLSLNAKMKGEIDIFVASVGVYGKVKILQIGANVASKAWQDTKVSPWTSRGGYTTVATNTLSTGSGEMGIEGKVCIPCLALFPIPVYTSFKQKITNWGNAYSRTGNVWNESFQY
jgi:hypothetical protein